MLLPDELRDFGDVDSLQLHVDGLALDLLVLRIVRADVVEQGVGQRVADGHPLVGVELQRVQQEILHVRCDELEQLFERPTLLKPERFYVVLGSFVADEIEVFLAGGADDVEDDGPK